MKTGTNHKCPVEVNNKGIPMGKMLKPFKVDIKSMARAMDPSEGYLGQTLEAREMLMVRICDKYEFVGMQGKVSEAFIKILAGKALI
jgi:hypothetical protein